MLTHCLSMGSPMTQDARRGREWIDRLDLDAACAAFEEQTAVHRQALDAMDMDTITHAGFLLAALGERILALGGAIPIKPSSEVNPYRQ